MRDQLGSNAVVALGAVLEAKPIVMIACAPAAIQKGVRAGDIAKKAASVLGGGGGGKPDLAQGGGTNAELLSEALASAVQGI